MFLIIAGERTRIDKYNHPAIT